MSNHENFLQVTGGKIWYKVLVGNAKNTPLIVLHGGPGSSSYSMQTLHALSQDRTVVFYDQLGCGLSDRSDDTNLWKKERFVLELETLREHLGFNQISLLGQSWGTMLAVLYTLKYPKRVKALALSGPFFSSKKWIEDTNKLKLTLPEKIQKIINENERNKTYESKEYEKATLEFYKKYFCRIYPYPKPIRDGRKLKMNGEEVYNIMWGPTEFHCTGNLKNVDLTEKLKEIKIPVLLMCGKYDMATPETTRFYMNQFPNGKMEIFDKSAHLMFLEEKRKIHQNST